MEVAITKISQNGQIVIPSEIRREAGIEPFSKFIVFNEGENILLKKINKKNLSEDMKLVEKVFQTEKQIKKGDFIKVDSSMSEEEIDNILTN